MESSTNSPAEHRSKPVESDDTKPSIGYLVFAGALILLLTLLIILAVILIRRKTMNARRMKRAAAIQQPVDLLAVDHQFQREEGSIHSITFDQFVNDGPSTVYSGIPDFNCLGPHIPSTYNTTPAHITSNAACSNIHRGSRNHFGFFQYANVHDTVSKRHHPQQDVADSTLKISNALLGRQQDTSNYRLKDLHVDAQTTCVPNDSVTVGADGTQYLQMNAVKYLVQTPTGVSAREPPTQSAFSTSTYAHIDHSLKVSSK